MLTRLEIHNYAIIDTLSVSFGPGMHVLTGVIGAGNTMVLGGLVSILVVMAIWQFMPGVKRYEYQEFDPNAPSAD